MFALSENIRCLSCLDLLSTSMQGYQRPLRFPIVDDATGLAEKPVEVADTVDKGDVPVLEVKGLTKRFDIYSGLMSRMSGRVHAVENVSFDPTGNRSGRG